jgi:CubicO group peptidase (beta-lactamase class C family)
MNVGWILLPALALLAVPAVANTPMRLPTPIDLKVEFDLKQITATSIKGEAGVVGRDVAIDDPVRVASISKLVGALAVMRLVDQGKIVLDRDINDYLGWRVRNPAFPDQPITMQQLLTHRSGIRDNVDYILPLRWQHRKSANRSQGVGGQAQARHLFQLCQFEFAFDRCGGGARDE